VESRSGSPLGESGNRGLAEKPGNRSLVDDEFGTTWARSGKANRTIKLYNRLRPPIECDTRSSNTFSSLNPISGARVKQTGQTDRGVNRRRAEKAQGRKVLRGGTLGVTGLGRRCREKDEKRHGRRDRHPQRTTSKDEGRIAITGAGTKSSKRRDRWRRTDRTNNL